MSAVIQETQQHARRATITASVNHMAHPVVVQPPHTRASVLRSRPILRPAEVILTIIASVPRKTQQAVESTDMNASVPRETLKLVETLVLMIAFVL